MAKFSLDKTKAIKLLINQAKTLKLVIENTLRDPSTEAHGRFVSFKTYAIQYNEIVNRTERLLELQENSFSKYLPDNMASHMDTLWPIQKEIMESVLLQTGILLTYLESATDFAEDEVENLENFFISRLRTAIFDVPQKEMEVQNAIESLLVGRGMTKGVDYDRETGKFEFSGKEYIPDFIIPKLNLCLEVKLLKVGKKSKIIEEINADTTAYSKQYDRQMFIVYDLGVIRDEAEFKRDIENCGEIKVIIVKH